MTRRITNTVLLCCLLWPVAASADWYNSNWQYRMPITLDSTQVAAALNDFPVLINTANDEAFVRDNLAAGVGRVDGGDIVFTADDGTSVLSHEIEFFDDGSGEMVAWVRVPELDPSEDTQLFIYYGNGNAGDMQQVTSVWNNGYGMVQHLQEEGGKGTPVLDSTAQANDGEIVGTGGNFPQFVAGDPMDGARFMTGNQQGGGGSDQPHIPVPHSASIAPTATLTAEVWARADSNLGDGVDHHPVMFKGERMGWGANYLFRIAVRNGSEMTWGVTCGGTEGWFHAGTPQFDQWAHYAITFDGTTARAYINGQEVGSTTACSGQSLNAFPSQPLRSGWAPRRRFNNNDQTLYRGDVDEMRISAASRSQSWLETQFNNQSNAAGFHTFGAQKTELQVNLAAEYRMEELAWTENAGEVKDNSDNALDGTGFGGATTADTTPAVAGDPGTCRYGTFDGVDDYVEVPHDAALNGTDVLTYSAWIHPRSHFDNGNPRQVMAKSVQGGGSGRAQMGLFTEGGDFVARVETADGRQQVTAGLPPLDQWTHVTAVFDGQSLRLYYDASEQAAVTFPTTTLLENTDPLMLGKRVGSAEYFWDGFIDEARVYTMALNNEQVNTVFAQTHPCAGPLQNLLISYWFDQDWADNGDSIPDQSGEGRTGTSNGAVFQPTGPDGARPDSPGTCGFSENPSGSNVTAPMDADINNADSFTLAFWLQMTPGDQTNNAPSLVAGGNLESFFAERFEVLADFRSGARDLVFVVRQDGGPSPERVLRWTPASGASNDPFSGNWVHVAVRHDMAARELRIYANGSVVAEANYSNKGPDALLDATGSIQIGGFSSGVAPANILHDEFRMAGRPLTDDDIDRLFAQERICPSLLDSFQIDVPATASVCEPAPVTLTALDSSGNVVTNYTGTANLTTSSNSGNWALDTAQGTLSPDPHTANDGAASYSFVDADDGSASLTLSNKTADSLTITATDSAGGQSGTSSPVQFQENAFVISQTDSLGSDFVAGRDHALQVEAVSRDPSTGECGLITEYDGNIDLKGWIQRGADDPGGNSPVLSDGAGSDTMPDSEPAGNNTTLAFNQGAATPQWLTTDVGQYALNLKDDSSGIVEDENGDPIPVVGAGPEWVVRPFGFHTSVTGPEPNPGASAWSGSAFLAAGESFDVRVRAVAHEAGDDSDDDGIPDDHDVADPPGNADLSDNATTTAFGSGPSLNVGLTSKLVAGPSDPPTPDDPNLSGMTSISSFSSGEATVSVSYLEVGSISLLADIGGSYLGRAATVIGRSGYVGRFHPYLFTAQPTHGSFAPECNGFVYSGQGHGYGTGPDLPKLEIVPRRYVASGTGPVTTNYRGKWQLLEASDVSRDFPTQDGGNDLDVTVIPDGDGTLDPDPVDEWRMIYSFGADEYTYVKDENARIAPFPSDLTITVDGIDDGDAQLDSDQNPIDIKPTGVEIRYGRLRLDNTYGPETLDLTVPMRAEHWGNSGRFTLNLDESCWSYNTDTDVTLDQSGLSGGSTSVVSVTDTLVAGEPMDGSELVLTAPGEGNTGQVGVTFTVPTWLQDDYNGDGALQNPTATATFGVYRGHDRIIYWREAQ